MPGVQLPYCTTDTDCTEPGEICSLQPFDNRLACGKYVGCLTPAKACANLLGSQTASTLNCTTMNSLYACETPNKESCYAEAATDMCCGCPSWTETYRSESCCVKHNSEWEGKQPETLAMIFKDACPTAYTFPFDDKTSTFGCKGTGPNNLPAYEVTFCPKIREEPKLNFTGIGLDYDPSARCSLIADWPGPAACNPQGGSAGEPTECQTCFDTDVDLLTGDLNVKAVTIYQPNYYFMRAAHSHGITVLLGTFQDTVTALATPDTGGLDCTSGGQPTPCGETFADVFFDGGCGVRTPWKFDELCFTRCEQTNSCVNPDCSCSSDPDCGSGNTCMAGQCSQTRECSNGGCLCVTDSECGGKHCVRNAYLPPLKEFFDNGTVICVQLGNEVFANDLTLAMVQAAAQTMRDALNKRSYGNLPIVVSVVTGNAEKHGLCTGGKPVTPIDLVAAHPYCAGAGGVGVSSKPPAWPFEPADTNSRPITDQEAMQAAEECAQNAIDTYLENEGMVCGREHTFIGETGYSTGCPGLPGETNHVKVWSLFPDRMIQKACVNNIQLFLFENVDVCEATGCLAGCADTPEIGQGYWGFYYTENYGVSGMAIPKFPLAQFPDLGQPCP